MTGYLIKRKNITADDITYIGKRFLCGENAEPYDSRKSAKSAMKRQKKQDEEYCPDCIIIYEIVESTANTMQER